MALFKDKTDYVAIGRDALPEIFLAELRREKRNYKKNDAKNEKVLDGAFEAFRHGHPDNIRAYIADVKKSDGWADARKIARTLLRLTEESSDKASAINLALEAMTETQRQETLNIALRGACNGDSSIGKEPFYVLLLNAGADPNAKIEGYMCSVFAGVILNNDLRLVKLFHEHGGDFDKVLPAIDWHPEAADKIKFYREALEDKPPAAEAGDDDLRRTVIEMRQQIQDLTAVVSRIAGKVDVEFSTEEPAEQKKPAQRRKPSYPSLNF